VSIAVLGLSKTSGIRDYLVALLVGSGFEGIWIFVYEMHLDARSRYLPYPNITTPSRSRLEKRSR
jgi:hypothetical protein